MIPAADLWYEKEPLRLNHCPKLLYFYRIFSAFFLYFVILLVKSKQIQIYKNCWWLDSNQGRLVL